MQGNAHVAKGHKPQKAAAVSRCGFMLAEGSSTNKTPPRNDPRRRYAISVIVKERIYVLGRSGSDLLFQALRLSTIGAGEFNGRVRDGIGFRLPARTTRPAKDVNEASWISVFAHTEMSVNCSRLNASDEHE